MLDYFFPGSQMEENDGVSRRRSSFSFIHLVITAICLQFVSCDAIRQDGKQVRSSTNFRFFNKFETNTPLDLTNSDSYDSSPFYFPPYDSLPPSPSSEHAPPYCVHPPFTPQPPLLQTPPTASYTPPPSNYPSFSPLFNVPSPIRPVPIPPLNVPSPTQPVLRPPPYFEPVPPCGVPSPEFLPPIVYPPPSVPPPPYRAPFTGLWCVAKASVPDPMIEEAMNYACGSGADCGEIQAGASCFEPDTLFSHASYAFNSYWQRTKTSGGTCDFGGTAVRVTVDPSYDGCHFIFS